MTTKVRGSKTSQLIHCYIIYIYYTTNVNNGCIGLGRVVTIKGRREGGNVIFNDTLNTFHLQLYDVRHMVKDHSDSDRENLLPPLYELCFPISSKGFFYVHHRTDKRAHTLYPSWNNY